MINADFDTILDNCLTRLRAGESISDCLADYPEQAEYLRPLLITAANVQTIPTPRPRRTAVAAGRRRMAAAVDNQFPTRPVSFSQFLRYASRKLSTWTSSKETDTMKLVLRTTLALFLVLIAGGALAASASAQSLPGDTLYPVKRTLETVQLTLTLNQETRQTLEMEQGHERQQEIETLMRQGRQEIVEFTGQLEAGPNGGWLVNGLQFQMTAQTQVEGLLAAGQTVTVRIQTENNGLLTALRIRVEQNNPINLNDDPYPGPGMTATPMPSSTDMPGPMPSHTPMPGSTDMPGPGMTATPMPGSTDMPGPMPSHTPMPGGTDMPGPLPSHTPMPGSTDMPGPMPTTTTMPNMPGMTGTPGGSGMPGNPGGPGHG